MAKNNNLGEFMTDLADAIRQKTGLIAPINPQDFSNKILSIQAGGGGGNVINDVNFFDYDGTLLHSYSAEDFLKETSLPPLPSHAGLICQEWNWSLEDAMSFVEENGKLDVGATYITDDDSTRLYINIPSDSRNWQLSLYFSQSVAHGVQINWGDGSDVETIEGTGYLSVSHTYAYGGRYKISLYVQDGTMYLGNNSLSKNVFGSMSYSSANKDFANLSILEGVELGLKTYVSKFGFCRMRTLKTLTLHRDFYHNNQDSFNTCGLKAIVLPSKYALSGPSIFQGNNNLEVAVFSKKYTGVPGYMFNLCKSLKRIVLPCTTSRNMGPDFLSDCSALQEVVLPNGLQSCGNYMVKNCAALTNIVFPNSVTSIGDYSFFGCKGMTSIVLPQSLTAIPQFMCQECEMLNNVTIPEGVTEIKNSAFAKCYALPYMKIPSSVTKVTWAWTYCVALNALDFSDHTAVPTLAAAIGTSAGIIYPSLKIIVPDALYDSWIAATNWSGVASYIIKKSEWDSQNA